MVVDGKEENGHGIVLAANQIAKRFGIKTGDALWEAKANCPDEEEAYSLRSVRRGLHAKNQDPRIKILGPHFYKELGIDNEQLKITAKDDETGKIYLQMKEEDGTEVMSDADILLKSKSGINVMADTINLRAEDRIVFVNSPGSIIMDGKTHIYNTLIGKKAAGAGDLSLLF